MAIAEKNGSMKSENMRDFSSPLSCREEKMEEASCDAH
jgi:hypothetical protein